MKLLTDRNSKFCLFLATISLIGYVGISNGELLAKTYERGLVQVNDIDGNKLIKRFQKNNALEGQESLTLDRRTNTIIANLRTQQLANLRSLATELDRPAIEVKFDSYVIETKTNYNKILSGFINNTTYKQLPTLLDRMQADHKIVIISHPTTAVANKETAIVMAKSRVSCCELSVEQCRKLFLRHNKKTSSLQLAVLPEVFMGNKIELTMSFSYDQTGELEQNKKLVVDD